MERTVIAPGKIVDGVLYVNTMEQWFPAPDVIPACAGEADSIGFVLISGSQARYVTDTQPDAQFLLQEARDVLTLAIQLSQQVIAITQAQFIISADNAQWGVNQNLTPIGEAVAGLVEQMNSIASELGSHKVI